MARCVVVVEIENASVDELLVGVEPQVTCVNAPVSRVLIKGGQPVGVALENGTELL